MENQNLNKVDEIMSEEIGSKGKQQLENFFNDPTAAEIVFSYTKTEGGDVDVHVARSGDDVIMYSSNEGEQIGESYIAESSEAALTYANEVRKQISNYLVDHDNLDDFAPKYSGRAVYQSAKDCTAAVVKCEDDNHPVLQVESPVLSTADAGSVSKAAVDAVIERFPRNIDLIVVNGPGESNITHIEDGAFHDCSATAVRLLGSIESLGENSLPSTVKDIFIDETAPIAQNKEKLIADVMKAGAPPTVSIIAVERKVIAGKAFDATNVKEVITGNAEILKELAEAIVGEAKILKGLDTTEFKDAEVAAIDNHAFDKCENLPSIEIPKSNHLKGDYEQTL